MANLDEETVKRMGYENVVAAEGYLINGVMCEFALIGPTSIYGRGYYLATHIDCDPENVNQGGSQLDECGSNLKHALGKFDRAVQRHRAEQNEPSAPSPM